MMQLNVRQAILGLLLSLFGVAVVSAQSVTGAITGTVTDSSGAAVVGAQVSATNTGTNDEQKIPTDPNGFYRFTSLPPGTYVISVEATGFRKTNVAPQRVSVADNLRLDVHLEVGAVTETVTVDSTAVQVNTDDAQLGRVLTDIPNLPILSGNAGRNVLNLILLQPGVINAGSVGPFSVNGQRAQANNYLLDGADSNDLAINVPDSVTQISPDAVQEFRVVTGAFKAEYGRNSGSVINLITKGGTNQFHGVASEVFRNKSLNATPFFQKVTPGGSTEVFANGLPRKPKFNLNDFDAQFGGPIIKDKTFFSVSYLGFRRSRGVSTSATVFNDADRAAITQFGTPAAKAILALVPAVPGGGNVLFAAPVDSLTRDQGVARLDHRFSEKNTFSGTYFNEKQSGIAPLAFGGSPLPGFGEIDKTNFWNLVLQDTHIFRPNLINEFRASIHRREQNGVLPINKTTPASLGLTGINPDDPAGVGVPYFDITGYSGIGNTYQGPQARYDTTWQYSDYVTFIKGKHNFKFGADFRAYQQNQLFDFLNSGYIYFDGGGTDGGEVKRIIPGISSALNDFINGYATEFDQSNSNRQGYRDKFINFFAQDDWKVGPRVTINLGLRYEYNQPLTEINRSIAAFRPGQQSTAFPTAPVGLVYPGDKGITDSTYKSDYNNFAPRVGVAWDVRGDGKTSVRAGFGLFYDAPVSELTLQFLGQAPFGLSTLQYDILDYTRPYATSANATANPFLSAPSSVVNHLTTPPLRLSA